MGTQGGQNKNITSFNFSKGELLNGKYLVVEKIGEGWEGEVYLVEELATGIERAAKFFFPHRNIKEKASKIYAQKLHALRKCPAIVQYQSYEKMLFLDHEVSFLLSEFVMGKTLDKLLAQRPAKKLNPFEALHLLYSLTRAVEDIHQLGSFHGDIHTGNIIVERHGLEFDIKILDMFQFLGSKADSRRDDILGCIQVFHESLGGAKTYAKHPAYIKKIIMGLKGTLILTKFKTISRLRLYLENLHLDVT